MKQRAEVPEQPLPRRHRPDYWLAIIVISLLVIGLVVIYSIGTALGLANNVSSNYYIDRQMLAIGLSAIAFAIASSIPLEWWRRYYKLLLAAGALATLMAVLMPVNPQYPAHRWVRLGSLSFQSVELVTFAVVIWLAKFLADRMRKNQLSDTRKTLWPLIAALVILGVAIAGVQSDLGSIGVILAVMSVMIFVAGMPLKKIVMVTLLILVVGGLAISTTPYRRERLATFLHPTSNCLGNGYQSCQALIAVGSGGAVGLGLGRSVQAYGYLPESANDSIFAIYSEKFGFIGDLVLLGLFAALFTRIKKIAMQAPNNFTRLLAIGILAWLSTQALINIGAMIGLLPLKGITLPLISYGGTSILFIMLAIGILFQISRYTSYVALNRDLGGRQKEGNNDNHSDRRRLGRAYNTSPGGRS